MRVIKFGGSSVGDLQALSRAAAIVKAALRTDRVGIVVSALRGMTDHLIAAANAAPVGDEAAIDAAADVFLKAHKTVLDGLALSPERDQALAEVTELAALLRRLLHGARVVGACTAPAVDQIVGFGERAAVPVVKACFAAEGIPTAVIDAADHILTDETFGQARILYQETFERLGTWRDRVETAMLMAGFIGRSRNGRMTTLGRNGSDHSAAVLARALDATILEIRTDADGVFSADPRIVKTAYVLPELSYSEAMEIVRIGAKVIHPLTFVPVMDAGIPVRVCSTFRADAPGTYIRAEATPAARGVRGLTLAEDTALVNVVGAGMTGTPGAASYVFSVLAGRGINLLFIALTGSERSLCFAVRDADARPAKAALEENLQAEKEARFIQSIDLRRDVALLSAVGDGMRGHRGTAGRFFSVLAESGVNVVAIAQGMLEANITVAIDGADAARALEAAHREFLET